MRTVLRKVGVVDAVCSFTPDASGPFLHPSVL
jgi:hypothetical protein